LGLRRPVDLFLSRRKALRKKKEVLSPDGPEKRLQGEARGLAALLGLKRVEKIALKEHKYGEKEYWDDQKEVGDLTLTT